LFGRRPGQGRERRHRLSVVQAKARKGRRAQTIGYQGRLVTYREETLKKSD